MSNDNSSANAAAVSASAAAAAAAAGVEVVLPSFTDDPSTYLLIIGNQPPSKENLYTNLAGPVASWIKEESNPQLAFLYLQAVAKQLPSEKMKTTTSAAVALAAAAAAITGGPGSDGNSTPENNNNMEVEMIRAQRQYEILDAIGYAVAQCKSEQRSISRSGIIPALASLVVDDIAANKTKNGVGKKNNKKNLKYQIQPHNLLSNAHVELLQACIVAGQYRFAQRIIDNTWPRPNPTVSVRQVLRYFYLRGMVHMGCHNWRMAVRCFWTCLSIPSEVVSAIAIAAWKKMVLVQCLLIQDEDDFGASTTSSLSSTYHTNNDEGDGIGGGNPMMSSSSSPSTGTGSSPSTAGGPLSLPKALPPCMGRFLSSASSNPKKTPSSSGGSTTSTAAVTTSPEDTHQPGGVTGSGSSSLMQNDILNDDTLAIVAPLGTTCGARATDGTAATGNNSETGESTQPSFPSAYFGCGVRTYIELVHAFLQRDRKKFVQIYSDSNGLFNLEDGNMDMIHLCEKALLQRQIWHLSRIYAVVPLSLLSSTMAIQEDKMKILLLQLSMEKSWCIQVEEPSESSPRMVVFTKQPNNIQKDSASSSSSLSLLEKNARDLIQLTSTVQKLDAQIATSTLYHATARKSYESRMGPRGVEDL